MNKVYRVYVEKRKEYAVEAVEILNNLKTQLKIEKDYHLIVSRRRGMYREFSSDY